MAQSEPSYLVGEQGPELYIPKSSGGGGEGGAPVNSVVNVSIASDGSVKTDAAQATQMGRLIESSVVGIITRERRPGGLLSR